MALWRVAVSFSSLSEWQWSWLLALRSYLARKASCPSLAQVTKKRGKDKHSSNSTWNKVFLRRQRIVYRHPAPKELQQLDPTGGYLATHIPTLHHRLTSCETVHYLVLMPPSPCPPPLILAERNCSKFSWSGSVDSWNTDIVFSEKHDSCLGSSSLDRKQ